MLVEADWGTTCTGGCICKWADGKKVADCTNKGFTTIPEGLSPEIQVLELRGNTLDVLVEEAFSSVGLVNLQRIHLRNCSIRTVHKNAFAGLSIMIEVDLSFNLLQRIHPDTFTGNDKLRLLILNGNPLEKLEAHQFPSLGHLRTLELMNCGLQMVDKKAFIHLSVLETLKLSDNHFTTLKPEVLLPLNKLKSVDLQGNPWMCDCHLLGLRDYLSEANLNSTLTLCKDPQHLVGKSWSRLAKEDFACKPKIHVLNSSIEGKPGYDVTFSCLISGTPLPNIWWVLQNKNEVTKSQTTKNDHFSISEAPAETRFPTTAFSVPRPHVSSNDLSGDFASAIWSNLTLRAITDQDRGEYRCVASNKGGKVEGNILLSPPAAPVIVLIPENVETPYTIIVIVAAVVAVLLLFGLLTLTVCLCRRHKKRVAAVRRARNGNGIKSSGNGSAIGVGKDGEQEKSLLDIEMDNYSQTISKNDGYQVVSQAESRVQHPPQMQSHPQQLQGRVRGSLTYIPGEKFDERVPESGRLLFANGATLATGSLMRDAAGSPILLDGCFYPDLLDIPHRGRGGGSPSTMSASSAVPDASRYTMPLNAAHLVGHPNYATVGSDYRVVPVALPIHPPLQFTDSLGSSDSKAVMVPTGPRPGYVTLPRRPKPRMPSWSSTPSSSPAPPQQQPIYDTIGPRITADGSSSSALSLNKIAGLTPATGSPTSRPNCNTLGRVHKISLPAYYVPIEEVDIPQSSSPMPNRSGRSSTLPLSTPNIVEAGNQENNRSCNEPVLPYFASPRPLQIATLRSRRRRSCLLSSTSGLLDVGIAFAARRREAAGLAVTTTIRKLSVLLVPCEGRSLQRLLQSRLRSD